MANSSGIGIIGAVVAVAITLAASGSAGAATNPCKNTADFGDWLAAFTAEARKAGVSKRTIAATLADVTFDPVIIAKDRQQSVFTQSFLQFSDRMVSDYRIKQGRRLIKKYGQAIERIEKLFGVPGPVLTALWALETDFGANTGDLPTIRSLATLAYDCRRPEHFRPELLAALKLVDRGDLAPEQMVGAWAGELGQTQFLPSYYVDVGVDFDEDGRVDLLSSPLDVLASTANLLKYHGWKAGEPWLLEVRVPDQMAWQDADLTISKSHEQWSAEGVTLANGEDLPPGEVAASLLLPMGRLGPAFLAYPNYQVFLQWNQSIVYATTASYLATRVAGAPRVGRGNGEPVWLPPKKIKELQTYLARRGHDVGEIDGKLGSGTRAAVRAVQAEYSLPADGFPTVELINLLREGQ